jgi:hypothetical protein
MNTLKSTFLFVIALLLVVVIPAHGREFYQDVITVEVISDHRGSLQEYPVKTSGKWQRSYIEAQRNERYRIRVRNNNNKRVGLVITVDGRNIISGKKSHLKHNEAMYVLGPWESAEYTGWRTSKNRENRFYFTNVQDSYADAWGDRSAMGVIAVAAFPEKWQEPRLEHDGYFGRSGKLGRSGTMRKKRNNAPGTGFGEGNWSPSHEVNFIARHRPLKKEFIKYEWRKTLCRRGIMDCDYDRPRRHQRNRFWPEEEHSNDFAPFPPAARQLLRQLLPW